MRKIDLNADVGEGCGNDTAIIPLVSSINVACGGHAGDEATVQAALDCAATAGVAVGAHPSYPDQEHFGRRILQMPKAALRESLEGQILLFCRLAKAASLTVAHVKPHGALYHEACRDEALAELLCDIVQTLCPAVTLVGPPGQHALAEAAARYRLAFRAEGFADRGYEEGGSLLPRGTPGAMILDHEDAARQAVLLAEGEGIGLPRGIETICLHGDAPEAAARVAAVRTGLEAAGFMVSAP